MSRLGTDVYIQRRAVAHVTPACVTASTRRRVVPVPKYRDITRIVERDGWRLARTRGSHRVYTHPTKRGIVVIAGHPSDDVQRGIWMAILRQAGLREG